MIIPLRNLTCFLLFSVCNLVYAQSPAAEPIRSTFELDGLKREYFVRLPQRFNPSKTYWLLVSVHGGGGNGRNHFLATAVREEADEQGLDAIVVSPSFSNTDFQASRFPDLGEGRFLVEVIKDLNREYHLRPKILLTGYSRGGQFSHRFAFSNPELVEAVAPFSSGTWTTPDGRLLVEALGEVKHPDTFLADAKNADLAPERLRDIFDSRVARVAGLQPRPGAEKIPFLVMCGSLDTRYEIAQEFVLSIKEAGYSVESEWPRTPHGSREKQEFAVEFEKYSKGAVKFFKRVTSK